MGIYIAGEDMDFGDLIYVKDGIAYKVKVETVILKKYNIVGWIHWLINKWHWRKFNNRIIIK